MSVGELAQIISSLAAIGGLGVSLLNRKNIRKVHDATNGLSHEFNVLTAKSSRAEGVKEGLEEGRHESRGEQNA